MPGASFPTQRDALVPQEVDQSFGVISNDPPLGIIHECATAQASGAHVRFFHYGTGTYSIVGVGAACSCGGVGVGAICSRRVVGVRVGRRVRVGVSGLAMKMTCTGSENGPTRRSISPTIARARNTINILQGICFLSR
jgi:hypothetical protein